MSNIEKQLTLFKWVIYNIATIVALTPILLFWSPDSVQPFFQHELIEQFGGTVTLASWQKLLGFFVASLPAACMIWALSALLQLTRLLGEGLWFDMASEIQCRRFAKALLWFVAMEIIHRTLLVLVLTVTNPVGEKHLYVAVSSNDLMTLVPAILTLIFAHMVSLARAQQRELQQIV